MNNLTLITGAVRSGKSLYAEQLAREWTSPVAYIATMPKLNGDAEQEQRIARHQHRRPASWHTIEQPYDLPPALHGLDESFGLCIIDCLSVYVSNVLIRVSADGQTEPYSHEETVLAQVDALLEAIALRPRVQFIVVSNETGWGIVPDTPLGRSFRDFLGIANQRFAAQAREVWLTCVGLPLRLKPQAVL